MISYTRRRLSLTMAAAAISYVAIPTPSAAASPAAGGVITYTATGKFAATPVSGADSLKLAGQPFTITVTASPSMAPTQHGQNWADYSPLVMQGRIFSALVGSSPIPIASRNSAIQQATSTSNDLFKCAFPQQVIGINLTIKAVISLPAGTLTNALLHTFSAVKLNPSNATVTYSDTSASTVLAIQGGTLTATVTAP